MPNSRIDNLIRNYDKIVITLSVATVSLIVTLYTLNKIALRDQLVYGFLLLAAAVFFILFENTLYIFGLYRKTPHQGSFDGISRARTSRSCAFLYIHRSLVLLTFFSGMVLSFYSVGNDINKLERLSALELELYKQSRTLSDLDSLARLSSSDIESMYEVKRLPENLLLIYDVTDDPMLSHQRLEYSLEELNTLIGNNPDTLTHRLAEFFSDDTWNYPRWKSSVDNCSPRILRTVANQAWPFKSIHFHYESIQILNPRWEWDPSTLTYHLKQKASMYIRLYNSFRTYIVNYSKWLNVYDIWLHVTEKEIDAAYVAFALLARAFYAQCRQITIERLRIIDEKRTTIRHGNE